jgi:Fur family peroxide stress response transcriptional regulator
MNYITKLQNHDLKATPQRLEIVDILYRSGHINIDDLYISLKNKFPSLSLATVYKNINTMCDRVFVSEVKIPNKKSLYELKKDEHAHIICTKCDSIMDITLQTSEILDQAEELSRYKIEQTTIIMSGVCPKCLSQTMQ